MTVTGRLAASPLRRPGGSCWRPRIPAEDLVAVERLAVARALDDVEADLLDPLEGRIALVAVRALASPPDGHAVFGETRINDAVVVRRTEGTAHASRIHPNPLKFKGLGRVRRARRPTNGARERGPRAPTAGRADSSIGRLSRPCHRAGPRRSIPDASTGLLARSVGSPAPVSPPKACPGHARNSRVPTATRVRREIVDGASSSARVPPGDSPVRAGPKTCGVVTSRRYGRSATRFLGNCSNSTIFNCRHGRPLSRTPVRIV